MEDLQSEISASFIESCCFLKQVNSNVRRIAVVPAGRQQRAGEDDEGNGTLLTKLLKGPTDLYVLWREFDVGLDGGKVARDYNINERGANWYSYSQRMNFWDLVRKLLRVGYTPDSAIDRVYEVYGRSKSVTAIRKNCKVLMGLYFIRTWAWVRSIVGRRGISTLS
jgi:hypothetical protein